jgi:hypothetical protein
MGMGMGMGMGMDTGDCGLRSSLRQTVSFAIKRQAEVMQVVDI